MFCSTGSTGVGWLYSLANEPKTNWGEVENFYRFMWYDGEVEEDYEEADEDDDDDEADEDEEYEDEGYEGEGSKKIFYSARVHGTIQTFAYGLPQQGDGIAFYHSTRADYPPNDPYRKKPRISLIGELWDVGITGRDMTHIRFNFDTDVLRTLERCPIIRDESTRHLFQNCGIVPGAVATLYHADTETWGRICSLIGQPVR